MFVAYKTTSEKFRIYKGINFKWQAPGLRRGGYSISVVQKVDHVIRGDEEGIPLARCMCSSDTFTTRVNTNSHQSTHRAGLCLPQHSLYTAQNIKKKYYT